MSIQAGDNHRLIEQKLLAFLPQNRNITTEKDGKRVNKNRQSISPAVRKEKKHGKAQVEKGESAPSGGGWEVIYTGFVLIMLCFFIMLCSFSKMRR